MDHCILSHGIELVLLLISNAAPTGLELGEEGEWEEEQELVKVKQ